MGRIVMSKTKSVIVAMSGGVDSSVAAGLLQQGGYEVTGVFMCLGTAGKEGGSHPGCCSPEDARDAKAVAARLGIPFHVLNFQKELDPIIDHFVNEYRQGRTPNPCILCNARLKFGKLFEYAELADIEYVATGHYAQIKEIDGTMRLHRGVDHTKDQSYALFGIEYEKLEQILLPNGRYRKEQIRELAREMNLPVHDKAESQEICFVPDNDYARFVAARSPDIARPGKVINRQGEELGEHSGIYQYTIGQRKGLGIALGDPAYVVELDAATNTVVLGSRDELMQRHLRAMGMNWLLRRETIPRELFEADIQIRYNHRGAKGMVKPIYDENDLVSTIEAEFDQPIAAITPGQAAVIYQNDVLLGGGWIESAS
jgi:tRNA-uridine 2-sulfurtransferase